MKELKNKKLVLSAIAREMNFWYDVSLKTDSEITKEEAENLIKEMSEIDTIGVTNEKQREAMYKNALLHNQCREWVSLIKTSYGRNKERIQAGKKTINIDERYMSSAEKFLYGELAVVMEMPRDKVSGYVKEHLDTERE